ncbi:MAG: SDR family NAD(P)-dependent oxidoreductase [Pseudomonadota bacterium]
MKLILVTGANKGIGLAIVEAILKEQENHTVLLGCRSLDKGKRARDELLVKNQAWRGRVQTLQIDVGDPDSVKQAADRTSQMLEQTKGELIGAVNNAGTAQGKRGQMLAVNVYGIKNVLDYFDKVMSATARIVNVTSASGPNYVADCASDWQRFFLDQNVKWPTLDSCMQEWNSLTDQALKSKGLPADYDYGLSKACANLLTLIAAKENPERSINACTPGYIDTDLTRDMLGGSNRTTAELGMKLPADGARVIIHLLFSAQKTSGFYYGSDAQRSPMDRYRSPGSAPYTGE